MPQMSKLKSIFSVFQREDRFLGVDIGSSSIKVVQLKKEHERAILETYGEISLAAYAKGEVGRAVALQREHIVQALTDVLREAQVQTKEAVVAVPLKDSFLTIMRMPKLPDNELRESIPYEARKYIPIPLHDVVVDWWVLPPSGTESATISIGSGTREIIDVFLAAVPKEILETYRSILNEVGISNVSFEIESFAFLRAALRRDVGTALLIDLGARSTKFLVVDGGAVRTVHHIEKGAQDLTLTLSQSLGVDFEQAEIMKRESGLVHRPETEGVARALEPIANMIVLEGERFLLDWKRKGGSAISRVMIGGGGALLPGIVEALAEKYGVGVDIANPFSKVVYPAFLEPSLREVGVSFTIALGAALKKF